MIVKSQTEMNISLGRIHLPFKKPNYIQMKE